ncbi:methylmalonyl-CoA carboxyltransferase 1.3S subunit [mine drainage metagenome]|uniref:Methylmalonyl-CoA carboxyltransferase 1.3S subunit n=1 Tax=mine drainage metagenome TaxID=410659 RepID=A0A1J5SFN2_9ZZZZ
MKKLRVTVEGKAYEVLVEILDETHAAAPAPVQPASVASASVAAPVVSAKSAAAPSGPGDIPSPLAGKVVSVDVKPGQAVTEGQQVATIEAMKMNTYVYAPRAGTVAEVFVNAGDAVDEGKSLVRLA